LPANTLVILRMKETVTSNANARGSKFQLEVAEDIAVKGAEVIPAGSPATGEVIHSTKSGIMCRPGELTITARYIMDGER
jgi:hypothetical protein